MLQSEGYEVDTASDGQLAWEKLIQQPGTYEAVLLDLQMPRMDGLHLMRALREQESGWATPLLVMSANREALQQAVESGGCQVLEKPFDLAAVLALIDSCLACHAEHPREEGVRSYIGAVRQASNEVAHSFGIPL